MLRNRQNIEIPDDAISRFNPKQNLNAAAIYFLKLDMPYISSEKMLKAVKISPNAGVIFLIETYKEIFI